MIALTYKITLLEPALLTALEGDPNESVSLSYIPGSVLRGALIRLYQNRQQRPIDAGDTKVRRLFFSGETRYLNAYPLLSTRRTLPTPLSWQARKGDETTIYDLAVETPDDENLQLQGVSKPFCSIAEHENTVYLVQPRRRLYVHTARTRRFGRAMPEDKIKADYGDTAGAVYRYDALEAGQEFVGYILCHGQDEALLNELLNMEILIGGSRSGGYGRAMLESLGSKPFDKWRELDVSLQNDSLSLTVTLLSDALIRNEYGQHVACPHAFTRALSAQLGVSLCLKRAFVRPTYVGGFNRKWGLPLPQTAALRMGSVFVYQPAEISQELLKELEGRGLGERRAEGFGRLAFNAYAEPQWNFMDWSPQSETLPTPVELDEESQRIAQRMAHRRLLQLIDEHVVKEAAHYEIKNPPSRSQIMRLRTILRDELMKPNPRLDRVENYRKQIGERNTARKQFTRARVGSQTLLDWLQKIQEVELSIRPVSLAGESMGVDETLLTVYRLRLIDAVLTRATLPKKREDETNG